ncbi:MAG: SDR family NAD(P)-dependent oxidoreductase [Cyanothece sp. SIO2G6]|nr:SDR family NAD(P)-dependent oxidoreductase [Cyanothece sp. SIO2G6]
MTQLSNTTILITGAAGGFGQELVRQLLPRGNRLILTDIDETVLLDVVSQIEQELSRSTANMGQVLACLPADLASKQGCDRLCIEVDALCRASSLNVDVLINNAGVALLGRMDEVPYERWEQLMQINLLSPMSLSAWFAKDMIARQQGHIVNIASVAGLIAPPGLGPYAASKFGLRGFSEGLYNDLAEYNVKVSVVYPFFSRTPILKAPRYGRAAQQQADFDERRATDPVKVMQAMIRGIEQDRLHVYPDFPSGIIQILRRLFPDSSNRFMREAIARQQRS